MGFRFWRRVRLAPGIGVNLSKSGASLSFGGRGAHYTVGSRGSRSTVGIPGTGLFYTTASSNRRGSRRAPRNAPSSSSAPHISPEDRLTLNFFQRLFVPDTEEAFVDGCRELVRGQEADGLECLERGAAIPDAAFMAGFLHLKRGCPESAARYLRGLARHTKGLGAYFRKYGMQSRLVLPITETCSAMVEPNLRGVLLGLTEACQELSRWQEAADCLMRLRELEPADVAVKLSLAELLMEADAANAEYCRHVVELAAGVENDSQLHAALMMYKGRALLGLGMPVAARDVLTAALRKRKDRPADLRNAIRYERIRAYDVLGRKRRVRGELEKLYAADPGNEDVARRLGVQGRDA